MSEFLEQDITYIKGIGPLRAEVLKEDLGLATVYDLLINYPFRYIDKRVVTAIKDVATDFPVQLKGVLLSKKLIKASRTNILTATLKDGSGFIELSWFKGIKYIEKYLEIGKEYMVYGKANSYRGKLTIAHPEMESAGSNELKNYFEPVYSGTERLNKLNFDSKARRKVKIKNNLKN